MQRYRLALRGRQMTEERGEAMGEAPGPWSVGTDHSSAINLQTREQVKEVASDLVHGVM